MSPPKLAKPKNIAINIAIHREAVEPDDQAGVYTRSSMEPEDAIIEPSGLGFLQVKSVKIWGRKDSKSSQGRKDVGTASRQISKRQIWQPGERKKLSKEVDANLDIESIIGKD